jgi:hypothetical protein
MQARSAALGGLLTRWQNPPTIRGIGQGAIYSPSFVLCVVGCEWLWARDTRQLGAGCTVRIQGVATCEGRYSLAAGIIQPFHRTSIGYTFIIAKYLWALQNRHTIRQVSRERDPGFTTGSFTEDSRVTIMSLERGRPYRALISGASLHPYQRHSFSSLVTRTNKHQPRDHEYLCRRFRRPEEHLSRTELLSKPSESILPSQWTARARQTRLREAARSCG